MWPQYTVVIFGLLCYIIICQSQPNDCDFQTSLSEDEIPEQLQPPANCMSGSFLWHYPRGTVSVNFPRSLLPRSSRKKMKVCLRRGIGDGLTSMVQVMRRRSRPLATQTQDSSNAAESTPWSCSRPSRSRRGITLTLHADQAEQFYLQSLQYRVEEVSHSRGSGKGNRRPGRRPSRRPGRNGNRDRDRGGKHTFPLGPGDHPMPSFIGRDPEN